MLKEKIKIKKAILSDSKFLLNTHNESVKQGYFSSDQLVDFKDHKIWFSNILSKNTDYIFIGYYNSKKIGYVRFNMINKGIYEVSIANKRNFQEKGFGTKLLKIGLEKLYQSKKPKKVLCKIQKSNLRSQKCFINNDFKFVKKNKKNNHLFDYIYLEKTSQIKKKYDVTFLIDKTNSWFEKTLKKHNFKISNKYNYRYTTDVNMIINQDIVFAVNYTKILSQKFLSKNKLVLIFHPSKLPHDRGFAPVQNQILKNKKLIYVTLIKAIKEVDKGPVYLRDTFKLDGTELAQEIRIKQGEAFFKIGRNFLTKYPKIQSIKQNGKGNFNKMRKISDSQLDIEKSIKSQFNLLRICDNELYPSFFNYKENQYIVKIFKKNKKI